METTTKCRKCNQSKNITEFYKSNKYNCKECIKTRVSKHRSDNIEKVRERDRNRPNAKERNIEHLHRIKNLTKEKDQEYKAVKKEIASSPEYKNRKTANTYLLNAIRDKRVIKKDYCEHCGIVGASLDGHHDNYLKPLEVIWLCKPCHGKEHKRLNTLKRGVA